MAAFTTLQRVDIRMYLGFDALYLDVDKRLENAMNAVQAVADGGTRPDSSEVTRITTFLTELNAIDAKMGASVDNAMAAKVDELEVDYARRYVMQVKRCRLLVSKIATILGVRIMKDLWVPEKPQSIEPNFLGRNFKEQ